MEQSRWVLLPLRLRRRRTRARTAKKCGGCKCGAEIDTLFPHFTYQIKMFIIVGISLNFHPDVDQALIGIFRGPKGFYYKSGTIYIKIYLPKNINSTSWRYNRMSASMIDERWALRELSVHVSEFLQIIHIIQISMLPHWCTYKCLSTVIPQSWYSHSSKYQNQIYTIFLVITD